MCTGPVPAAARDLRNRALTGRTGLGGPGLIGLAATGGAAIPRAAFKKDKPEAMDASVGTAAPRPYGVIALIGAAHATSHFYHLAVPVVFPLMKESLGVTYGELGLLATLFYIASGFSQFIAGFLVDRFGARRILFAGMAIIAGATLLCGLAPSYGYLLFLMPLAGIGNAVFHPADYAILNASVRESWLGRAYGVHTLGGNIGWAVSPVIVLGLASVAGWRSALVVAGLIGFGMLGLLLTQAAHLDDGLAHRRARPEANRPIELGVILLSPAILLCFAYFVLLAIAVVGVQNFLPSILIVDGYTLSLGTTALTGFLLASSVGTVAGAIIADKAGHHDRIVAFGLLASGGFIVAVAYLGLPALIVAALVAAGFALGMTLPSRDLLVRSATPRGATGRVFGFVYSGLDAGSAVAPVSIGVLLDHGETRLALWLIALSLFLAIGTTTAIVRYSRAPG